MTISMKTVTLVTLASLAFTAGLAAAPVAADARVRHRHVHATAPVEETPRQVVPQQQARQQQGVVGYFGPGAYGPFGYGPLGPFGYGYGAPRGDLGFALLGAANGGGLRGFVECGNYYARYPGACGF